MTPRRRPADDRTPRAPDIEMGLAIALVVMCTVAFAVIVVNWSACEPEVAACLLSAAPMRSSWLARLRRWLRLQWLQHSYREEQRVLATAQVWTLEDQLLAADAQARLIALREELREYGAQR